ncbi:protein DpdF [Nocardioides pelophilus]|uniref:protein DpdF n=1 Tax=Nocardioides pelophilus TaxID=2172019 RepID=UPI0016025300|nr:protein DpdF [Nocardioides pelophilus]
MDEEADVIEYLRRGESPLSFQDDLHSRLSGALSDSSASPLDRAVLLRQLLRRWSLRDGRDVPVGLAKDFSDSIRQAAERVGLRERGDGMWIANPWLPKWLECDGVVPDTAALAGTTEGNRFHAEPLSADPFFEHSTGFPTYQTPGQRAACRAVMSTPEGSTVIAMLPTGSGKTEIALCLSDRVRTGLTVIVVPTVALAYDFQRRFRDHFARRNKRVNPESLHFAWTASTDESTRSAFKTRIANGQQPLLVTSPESMTRALRQTLLDAASIGRLQGFVIDEAHLVTQWGRFFRPEFRTLSDLRRDLLQCAEKAGHARPVTLLLSATLGSAEMSDLISLFGDPGPCSPVVANALRSEPDIWIAHSTELEERAERVLDTLAHCARPAVLYVTKPEKAEEWLLDLRAVGYSRIAVVTGRSTAAERSSVLQGIRATPGAPSGIDLVVATSAFGLGIDYPHIRSVVHACLPETVDRWYQELGRGGRDGAACAAYLLSGPGDDAEAESLGVKVLSPAIAHKRWDDLWNHKRLLRDRTFMDLEGARGSVGRGDFNRRWNAQVIQGLIELGELRREQFDIEDIQELANKDDVDVSDWTAVSRIAARLGTPSFWEDVWRPWQLREMSRSSRSLDRIRDVSRLKVGACGCIAAAYAPEEELQQRWGSRLEFMEPVGDCGRCPECRRRGVAPYADPPPAPDQQWAVSPSDLRDLETFASAARGVNGCALVTHQQEEDDLALRIGAGLAMLGVRHFGGLSGPVKGRQGEATFFDAAPLSPLDLTPVSSFSYFARGQQVSRQWLARREAVRPDRDGHPLVDVLMVPNAITIGGRSVGKDIPSLAAATALELLPRS